MRQASTRCRALSRTTILSEPPDPEPEGKSKKKPFVRNPFVDYIEVRGPFNPHARPVTESHKHIFICGHASGHHQPDCARKIVSALAYRAYRRPVTDSEVAGLVRFVDMARENGDSFEQGMRVALEAIRVPAFSVPYRTRFAAG